MCKMVNGIQLKKEKLVKKATFKKEKSQIIIILTLEIKLASIKVMNMRKEINQL